MKEEGKHWNCAKLVIAAIINDGDMSVGARLCLGALGFVGAIIIDPVVYACDKLGFEDKSDDDDFYNPDDHVYPY